ncbi:MAG: hypothetical protein LBP42_06400 [Treponema sp.]|jgi:hypothetical protein|nr:hypothetical protein [Treponema sp.]
MPEITYDILKTYGVLSEEKTRWKKEVNLVSWNGRNPKIDIRDWAPEHEKMGKGITLTREEAAKLRECLSAILAEPEEEARQP